MDARRPLAVTHAAVLRRALPMTLATISTPLLGVVDATVIGRLGDAALLGALAACAVIFDTLYWAFGFLRLGTAALVAQATGAGDAAEESAAVARALIVAVLIGLVLLLLQPLVAWAAFRLLGASPIVTAAARQYFAIRVWSAPFTLANYALLGAVIGRGRMGLGLGLQVFLNAANAALNVWFVSGLGWGVRGSAFGTLIAEALGTGVGLVVVLRLHGRGLVVPRGRLLDGPKISRMAAMNRDIMIRSASLLFIYAFFTAQGARGGDQALAANAVLLNLLLITSFFLDGFATAAEQMCGQSVGADDASGFRAAVRLTVTWSLAFGAGLTALAFVFGPAFIALVSTSAAVRALAGAYLPFAALAPLAGALAFAFDGVFTGAAWTRDMRNLMLVSLAAYFLAFFALRPLGNAGLWAALIGHYAARSALQAWRYRALARSTFPAHQSFAAVPTAAAMPE